MKTPKTQIEEMARIACDATKPEIERDCAECPFDMMCDIQNSCEALYDAGYRKQSEGEWVARPDLKGFVCSNGCGELLTEIEDGETLPKFCSNCGTKMKNGTTIHEHVELLCKRLCRMKGGE